MGQLSPRATTTEGHGPQQMILHEAVKILCLVTQSCPPLCNPMDYSPPSSSVHGISQTRILEWVAITFSRGSIQPRSPALAGGFFTSEPPEKPNPPSSAQFSSVTQSGLTLCDPMNCTTPGLPVHQLLLEFTQTHVH